MFNTVRTQEFKDEGTSRVNFHLQSERVNDNKQLRVINNVSMLRLQQQITGIINSLHLVNTSWTMQRFLFFLNMLRSRASQKTFYLFQKQFILPKFDSIMTKFLTIDRKIPHKLKNIFQYPRYILLKSFLTWLKANLNLSVKDRNADMQNRLILMYS